ncbi:UDP-N-acetylmuramoyl-L-alanyl-D-glutamate--2,6-diaminopimelate ligase [Paraferrimonas haliotis]|uniref:UDP-N-acetylmuramoyl-L-alanyl-D-glutamate--2,6-diaminopimelate ligase n=1 Tax=Paraferrimonas haliotis TaxID=2013866 RepID=A0AA37TM99_9GAMM|nr:UDP-N-acetylmuramoyl-L-alanyl-D-glutamate--2,6-diaminopimelate ligase [Paraferrimonas haliotis]GLS82193.1 UDP-N-acetylmuramyl-tripeptide synthetase [Paraferrimonas haliotis]
MTLIRDLLAPWFHYAGPESFNNLQLDSRAVTEGDLFIAIPGHAVDGRRYIDAAITNGAAAVLCHSDDAKQHGVIEQRQVPVIFVSELSSQLAAIARQAYPFDGAKTQLIGVTGTNGKTSVSQLMAQLSSLLNEPAAVLGTIGNGMWGHLQDSVNTTSDPITTARQLNEFQQAKARLVSMEVSSHGLVQGRVATLPFSVAVFTNLSRDHLDYHGDMRNYALAKRRLFEFRKLKHRLFNIDDHIGLTWKNEFADQAHSYSIKTDADYQACNVRYSDDGVNAELVTAQGRYSLYSPLLGPFNLSNLIAALAALHLAGYELADLVSACAHIQPINGRMERFAAHNSATAVVDYAHTPDAIEHALQALRPHTKGKLWCVFGCGGDRDKGKRPLMAKAAEQNADVLVLTEDNPRSESVAEILRQMQQGLTQPQAAQLIPQRKAAIRYALTHAAADDLVLIAGKGHETYQEVLGQKYDYDERAFVRQVLQEQGEAL